MGQPHEFLQYECIISQLEEARFPSLEFLSGQGAFNGDWWSLDQFSKEWRRFYWGEVAEGNEMAFEILYGMT